MIVRNLRSVVVKMWPSGRTTKFLKLLLLLSAIIIITLEMHLRQGGLKSPAVYLRPTGGLGNQLFQYACAFTLAKKNNWPFYIYVPPTNHSKYHPEDRDFTLHHFNIPLWQNNSDPNGTLVNDHTVFKLNDFTILSGTYPKNRVLLIDENTDCQSEHFFLPYKDEILNMFVQNIETKPIRNWMEKISSKGQRAVAVHIRRGDLKALKNRVIHISYYQTTMLKISKMLKQKLSFFIFSDDMDYVKRELRFESDDEIQIPSKSWDPGQPEVHFVSSRNTSSIQEFYLMSICSHFIIPTSSFSWWAAYRNPNPNKIIIAAHYHSDFFKLAYAKLQWRHIYYPLSWIAVDPFYEDESLRRRPYYSQMISFPGYLVYFLVACSCSWFCFVCSRKSSY